MEGPETVIEEAGNGAPMTFEQATGAARLDEARRTRAAEVTESERNFVREFTAMLVTGLVVMLRVDADASYGVDGGVNPEDATAPGGCVAVTLALKQDRGSPVVEYVCLSTNSVGRVALGGIASVTAEPDPTELGYDLSARSFVVAPKDGADLLFHTENKDICSLVVDGLQMLIKDHARRAAKRKTLPSKKGGGSARAKKSPLKASN